MHAFANYIALIILQGTGWQVPMAGLNPPFWRGNVLQFILNETLFVIVIKGGLSLMFAYYSAIINNKIRFVIIKSSCDYYSQ